METLEHQKIYRSLMDLAQNLVLRYRMPKQVHVVIHDQTSGKRYGANMNIDYLTSEPIGPALVTCLGIGEFRSDRTILDLVDMLLKAKPGVPLLCDDVVAQEVLENSMSHDEGHHKLAGRLEGIIDVYVPFKSEKIPKEELPPNVLSAQLYKE